MASPWSCHTGFWKTVVKTSVNRAALLGSVRNIEPLASMAGASLRKKNRTPSTTTENASARGDAATRSPLRKTKKLSDTARSPSKRIWYCAPSGMRLGSRTSARTPPEAVPVPGRTTSPSASSSPSTVPAT